ncbi:4'-phosphopantetheinyl transferase [Actinoplanes sp. NPDC020271]|uniref:4'-phosphopantetheinyl transferase n=1 Tax=Actinoplanes sp. NPDC020271 TaxID=3363896 RepID=UPI0037B76D72
MNLSPPADRVQAPLATPAVLDGILPSCVASVERFDDAVAYDLFDVEERAIARTVDARRREFVTGRWCARRAMAKLGLPRVPIPVGHRGAPGWPAGVVGAITHCRDYRAAAVGRTREVLTIGIDAEPDLVLPDGVLDAVSLPSERRDLTELADRWPGTAWDRLMFSAKESVYKAWFPLARRWLDFDQARVRVRADSGSSGEFTAELLVPGPVVPGHGRLDGFTGRWAAGSGLVVTAIVVPAWTAGRMGSI